VDTTFASQELAEWMDTQGLGTGRLINAERLAGGTQNILIRFERSGRPYVLRRPPAHPRANSNETMRREAKMLTALAQTDVPHPRLIAACDDEAVLGAAFYLMEPVDGFNATIGLPPLHANSRALRCRMGLALVEGIAALGALDFRAIGLWDFGRPENYLHRQVERWRTQLEGYSQYTGWPGPDAIPGVEQVADWLTRNCPAEFQAGIIHGDYHLANVMYRPDCGELAAIIDWELTTIGDPLVDLGWMLATWPENDEPEIESVAAVPWGGFPNASALVEHYRQRTTRNLDALDWYFVLACFKLGIIQEGTHARACAGQAPMETGELLHAKTCGLFRRAQRRMG
jgi:aminoglycoside phosphotransferase (APT) family kinase protein